jgi:hypothetical protein
VRLGEHDLSTNTETTHVDINVAKPIPHPDYDAKDGHSDLAILVLENGITFTREFGEICGWMSLIDVGMFFSFDNTNLHSHE